MKNLDDLQIWLGNAGSIFLGYAFCHVLSVEVNSIMLSMCKSLDETYVYVLANYHVHICGKGNFCNILPLLLFFWWDFQRFGLFWLVGWLILFFSISSLVFHFLVELLMFPFMANLFFPTTSSRYFVYMSIVCFICYGFVQIFIFCFGSLWFF
jgi:hypothetical protein